MLCASACAAQAAGRVALVMVADDYTKFQKSLVGTKRATDIAEALTSRGFDVMVSTNPSNAAARASLRDFSAKVAGADAALVVLAGHGTAAGGQSFFLPANTELGRATDLLSRGLSIANVAQIVSRARVGAVFFFTTVPTFDTPVDGLDARPEVTGDVSKNVVVVFSNSPKVPLSRVDAGSAAAAESLSRALREPDATLADAARAAANGETGMVVGAPGDLAFAAPPPPSPGPAPKPVAAAVQAPQAAGDDADAARLAAERAARDLAEKRAREEQARLEQAQQEVARAQAEARKAQADVQKAQADAQRARAEAERAQAEAEKAKLEAKQIESQAQLAKAQAESAQAEAAKVAASARAETAQAEAAKAEAARASASAQAQAAQAEAARAEAARLAAAAQPAPAPAQPAPAPVPSAPLPAQPAPPAPAQVASLQSQQSTPRSPGEPLDESKLGQKQRQRIQEGLRELGLYTGPLDGVMGRQTREAVMGYQRSRRASVTGYLTTDQYEDLVPHPD